MKFWKKIDEVLGEILRGQQDHVKSAAGPQAAAPCYHFAQEVNYLTLRFNKVPTFTDAFFSQLLKWDTG